MKGNTNYTSFGVNIGPEETGLKFVLVGLSINGMPTFVQLKFRAGNSAECNAHAH